MPRVSAPVNVVTQNLVRDFFCKMQPTGYQTGPLLTCTREFGDRLAEMADSHEQSETVRSGTRPAFQI